MFFERLKELLQMRGRTKKELSEALGIGINTIKRWETSGKTPNQAILVAIANYFGVTTDYLLGYDADPKNITAVDGIISFEEIGEVKAGYNGLAEEIYTGKKIDLPISMLGGKKKSDYFVLRVSGDSMYPTLVDGDSILVERCSSVDSGSIAVVLYGANEATVKKVNYIYGCDWMELQPINPMHPPKRISGADLENCRILGKVVKLIRDFG